MYGLAFSRFRRHPNEWRGYCQAAKRTSYEYETQMDFVLSTERVTHSVLSSQLLRAVFKAEVDARSPNARFECLAYVWFEIVVCRLQRAVNPRPHALVVVLLLIATELLICEELQAQPSQEPELDSAVPTGIALSAFGSAAMIAGGALFATGSREETCPATPGGSCISFAHERREGGAMLLGAGAGLAAVGVPAMLGGLFARHRHLSDARMSTGIVFLGLGAAHTVMGIVDSVEVITTEFSVAGWALAGSSFLALGLPLLASGAPAPPEAGQGSTITHPAMANASYALFATGGAMISGGSLSMLLASGEDERIGLWIWGGTLIGVGGSVLVTAIPLVVAGTRRPRASALGVTPSLRLGPATASMTWAFD